MLVTTPGQLIKVLGNTEEARKKDLDSSKLHELFKVKPYLFKQKDRWICKTLTDLILTKPEGSTTDIYIFIYIFLSYFFKNRGSNVPCNHASRSHNQENCRSIRK